jgi:hypothetical protein
MKRYRSVKLDTGKSDIDLSALGEVLEGTINDTHDNESVAENATAENPDLGDVKPEEPVSDVSDETKED